MSDKLYRYRWTGEFDEKDYHFPWVIIKAHKDANWEEVGVEVVNYFRDYSMSFDIQITLSGRGLLVYVKPFQDKWAWESHIMRLYKALKAKYPDNEFRFRVVEKKINHHKTHTCEGCGYTVYDSKPHIHTDKEIKAYKKRMAKVYAELAELKRNKELNI